MANNIAVIGGSGLSESSLFSSLPQKAVVSSESSLTCSRGPNLLFANRHHFDSKKAYLRPHEIDFRTLFRTICDEFGGAENVDFVLGVCSVGTLNDIDYPVGTILVAVRFDVKRKLGRNS